MKKLTLLAAGLLSCGAMAKGPLTVEHLNQHNKIGNVALSPDGRFVVYSQTNGGFAPADTSHDLYLMTLGDNRSAKRLTQHSSREKRRAVAPGWP
ncbi:peptidase S9 [Alishewanella longhuensis]